MTFLYPFFSHSTAFILSVDIHHLFDMVCTRPSWPTWQFFLQTVPTVAIEKCKSDFFFFFLFLIHSYTYVVPISPVPKYSGGLSLRKNVLEGFKSTPLIVHGRTQGLSCFAPCLCEWGGSHWSVATQSHQFVKSLCLCQMVHSVTMIIFVVLLFGL